MKKNKENRGGVRVPAEGKSLGRPPRPEGEPLAPVILRMPREGKALLKELLNERNNQRKPKERKLSQGDFVFELLLSLKKADAEK